MLILLTLNTIGINIISSKCKLLITNKFIGYLVPGKTEYLWWSSITIDNLYNLYYYGITLIKTV